MKPKYNTTKFRNQAIGATSVIFISLSGTAMSQTQVFWNGSASTNWGNGANWDGGVVPIKTPDNHHAVINTNSPNIATISGGIVPPVGIFVGLGSPNIATLNHTAGDAATGSTNLMYIGRNGGNGTYNLANTAGTGGIYTLFAQGGGSMNVNSASLYIGGYEGTGSTGKVNVNTTGILSVGGDIELGTNSSTGTLNIDSGTVTGNGWIEVGNGGTGGASCIGTLNMSGGALTKTGSNHLIVGANGAYGYATIAGGAINVNNENWVGNNSGSHGTLTLTNGTVTGGSWFAIGRNSNLATGKVFINGGTLNKNGGGNFVIADSGNGELTQTAGTVNINGECWIGQGGTGVGKLTMSGGSFNVNNWVAVGRGGSGEFQMSGGTFTKTGGGNFLVCGAGTGLMNMTGGLLDVQSGEIQIPEGGTGTLNLSGLGAEIRGNIVRVGTNGGSTGNLNLNGGTLRATQIIGGGGTKNVSFNGTQIIAKAANTTFISSLTAANLTTGGMLIDSNNFSLTVPQLLTGSGGIVKSGLGTLSLTAANTNLGTTTVIDGKLAITTASDATGAVALGDFTGFGLTQTAINDVYNTSAFTFGISNETILSVDLGAFPGNTAAAPLNVTGASGSLTLNGTVTVNVADTNMIVGTIPLVSYVGSESGFGSFTLGTLPDGVVATLDDNLTGLVSLNVTRANDPYWTGTTNSLWNAVDADWKNEFGGVATTYADGDPAMFDDRVLAGPTAVVLNGTVEPGGSGVTFNNTTYNYTLTGTGKITGATGLLKLGTGSLDLGTVNDYTGITKLSAGTTNVSSLSNAGFASPLGMNDNLVLNGGTLNYTGATTTIDRGFTIAGANSTISTANDLTLGGYVSSTGGGFVKTGAGNLTLTNNASNFIGGSGQVSKVNAGTLSLIGSGSQTISIPGELWVGSTITSAANLVVQNSSLTVGSWFTLGRGNGDTGLTSTMAFSDSIIHSANISTGFNGGLPTNNSVQTITLNNTTWTNSAKTLFAESQNATTNLTLSGTSSFTGNGQVQMALNPSAATNVILQGNASMTGTAGWFSIGDSGTAVMTVKGNSSLSTLGIDLNVTDNASAKGTLNIQDTATVNAGTFYWGKGANTVAKVNISGGTFNGGVSEIAQNSTSTATITQTGGTLTFGNNDRMWFGQGGLATWNQSAGVTNCNGYLVIGRGTTSVAAWNVSGGTLNQTTAAQGIILAEQGTGTLTISGGGVVDSAGGQVDIATNAGTGTLNLNAGGTLRARQVVENNSGNSSVNFNGGTLIANSPVKPDFMHGVDTATINAGGATINSNGQDFLISQSFQGSGNLVKSGLGAVGLDGASTFTGSTTVSAGALGGTGSLAGALMVSPGATLAPGHSVGTFTAGATTISGTYACEISGATSDKLVANGTLNVSAATLAITTLAAPTASPLIIASYTGATPAPFASVTGLPSGYTVDYSYGGNQIALVSAATPFSTWAATNITAVNPGANATTGGDPDGDGNTNIVEFALNGNPLSGASSGKVVGKVASVGGSPTLVLTLPVRTGASFSGATEQVSALIDGVIYKVQGSDELATWNLIVSEVTGGDKTTIETGMPALDTGWTYRTFQSPGAITGDPADFLRAVITNP